MAIVNATTPSTVPPPQTTLKPPELGKNDFLNLLVAQLKNQDPLKPMDSSSFVAELAQFSQLEQSANQSKILQEVLDAQQASLQYSLLPLIGRDVFGSSAGSARLQRQPGCRLGQGGHHECVGSGRSHARSRRAERRCATCGMGRSRSERHDDAAWDLSLCGDRV